MNKFKALSKSEMKEVLGGVASYSCSYVGQDGKTHSINVQGDNVNQAQANADVLAYSDQYTQAFPSGIDCPGAV